MAIYLISYRQTYFGSLFVYIFMNTAVSRYILANPLDIFPGKSRRVQVHLF